MAPSTKFVSSLFSVIWLSSSTGRIGPEKDMAVGSVCPNRLTWPGPDVLRAGAAPTLMTCPATCTVCIGMTASATAMDRTATAARAAMKPATASKSLYGLRGCRESGTIIAQMYPSSPGCMRGGGPRTGYTGIAAPFTRPASGLARYT